MKVRPSLFATLVFLLACVPALFAQGNALVLTSTAALKGHWIGSWIGSHQPPFTFAALNSSDASLYDVDVHLDVMDDGAVSGEAKWIQKACRKEDDWCKVGAASIERFKGHYDAQSRVLDISGEKKDDPKDTISLGMYRFFFTDDGQTLCGISTTQSKKSPRYGKWLGLTILNRAKSD